MRRAVVALVCAGALALTVWGWRLVHTPLEPDAARVLARLSGVDPSRVSVGRVRWLGLSVQLAAVRVGPLWVERVRVGLDPLAHGKHRALLSGVTVSARGLQLSAAELALEVEHGQLKRAAFSGGRLGPLGELAGAATRDGDHFTLRAARPGLLLQGQVGADPLDARLDVRLELDRLPLAGLATHGLDGEHALASGAVELHGAKGRLVASGQLDLDELAIDHHSVASRRIEHLSPRLAGALTLADGHLFTDELRVTLGPLSVAVKGELSSSAFDVTAELEPLGCAQALTALRPILPALDGLVIDGGLSGSARFTGETAALAELQLALDLDVGCRVVADAPLADVRTLAGPIALPLQDPTGKARTFALGPLNPAWRSLTTLPLPLQRAFVGAEDGRFFRHHGFDAEMIRRALGHDLGQGRIEKGASTISQQLVKNVFLSGERTAARKLEEAVLTWRTEQLIDKRRILELYLNLVELGPGTYGVGEGAERYFGKEPEELSTDEAAQLAALLPAPRRGMDAAWEKRYQALKARLASDRVQLAAPPRLAPVKLTRR